MSALRTFANALPYAPMWYWFGATIVAHIVRGAKS